MSEAKTIICIDDEISALRTITLMCEMLGYETIAFENPLEAIEYIKNNHNDISLIFLDLMMPQIYGLNVLEILKKDNNTKKLPVVINSCLTDEREIQKSYRLGAEKFMSKPFNKSDIREVTNICIEKEPVSQ